MKPISMAAHRIYQRWRRIGWSTSFQEYRVYDIPEGILRRDGTNLISVRVKDIGGNAGIYEGPLGIVPKSQSSRLLNPF